MKDNAKTPISTKFLRLFTTLSRTLITLFEHDFYKNLHQITISLMFDYLKFYYPTWINWIQLFNHLHYQYFTKTNKSIIFYSFFNYNWRWLMKIKSFCMDECIDTGFKDGFKGWIKTERVSFQLPTWNSAFLCKHWLNFHACRYRIIYTNLFIDSNLNNAYFLIEILLI